MKKLIPLMVLALFAIGCAKKAVVKAPAQPAPLAQALPDDDTFGSKTRQSGQELTYSRDAALETVHFDYDRYELLPEARQTLEKNKAYLDGQNAAGTRVEGHCDQRGTVEYNLALGQRRANAVKEYYEQLGAKQVSAISYGKEKPLCEESGEQCWQLNRRAETLAGR